MPGEPRIVYLDVDDEITSAASRIRSADATRVALVVPPGSRVSTSRINFRLLAREAQASGKQLAIVAPDAASRSLAAAAGLDVYRSVGDYETAGAGTPPSEGGTGAAEPGAAGAAAGITGVGGASVPGADRTARTGLAPSGGELPDKATREAETVGRRPATPPADDLRPRSAGADVRTVGGTVAGRGRGRWLLGALAVLVVALLVVGGVAAYLLLPDATIVVVPRVEPVGPIETTVTADPTASTTDIEAGVVPAQSLDFPVQANGTFKATGQTVTETKATGTVTFTNCDPTAPHTIKAGSVVRTRSGIAFVTAEDVFLPVAVLSGPPGNPTLTCQRRDLGVTAAKAGTEGNVPAGSITVVPSDQNSVVISVTNPQPTSGGTHTVTPKVVQADVDAAIKALQKQLQDQFAKALQDATGVPAGLKLFPQTGKLGPATPTTDPTTLVGQEIAQFTLGAGATGTATAVDERPVTSVAEARLRSRVAAGHDLVAGSVKVSVGTPAVSGEKVTFPATATASQVGRLDPASLEAQVRGLPVDRAKEILSQYGAVTITMWPDWASAIPSYDFRVQLTIRPGAAIESPSPASTGGPASPSPS